MASTLGIDLNSKVIDLVLVDENHDQALHEGRELTGPSAFERARTVLDAMPTSSWYDEHGVYLVAIEKPFFRNGQDLIRLVQGAVLAAIPRRIEVWEVSPSQWKKPLGLPIREKPSAALFPSFDVEGWPQDALDALAVGLYARDLNAAGIAKTLGKVA